MSVQATDLTPFTVTRYFPHLTSHFAPQNIIFFPIVLKTEKSAVECI